MPEADGMILAKEEENDTEVRREDQDKINEFGQLNARLHEVREQTERLKVRGNDQIILRCKNDHIEPSLTNAFLFQKLLEKIDDASTELMMGNGDAVLLRLGDTAMFEATEDEATEFCEAEVEKHQEAVDNLIKEEEDILEKQAVLKKVLYGRFGKSINLEEK